MEPVVVRSLHAAAIIAILLLATAALKWWQKRRAGHAHSGLLPESGKAAVVYFHSPACGVCRTGQKPIIDRLLAHFGSNAWQLVMVDVSEQMDIAREWGVTTLPSTYVIGAAGEVTHVNNGLTSEQTLRRQIDAACVQAVT